VSRLQHRSQSLWVRERNTRETELETSALRRLWKASKGRLAYITSASCGEASSQERSSVAHTERGGRSLFRTLRLEYMYPSLRLHTVALGSVGILYTP